MTLLLKENYQGEILQKFRMNSSEQLKPVIIRIQVYYTNNFKSFASVDVIILRCIKNHIYISGIC